MTVDGVTSADVSYEDARAEVRYDSVRVTPNMMITAVEAAGFTAALVE